MPFAPGMRISHYEIIALAGSGGMGEVYRARDTDLKRDAALKILPPVFARDPGRMARFQREAEILASLNHPGIATIYGLVTDGDTRAIAMEFVEGPTLACPQALETALDYAQQIIESLEYAHDRGVMHRDLKPANIKITPEGRVKLLDFGLAKAIEDPSLVADPSNSPTLTLGHTQAGVIMGTAAYMSPEQAVGKPTDRRSDIFSFGSVMYEMLTGEKAFHGPTGPETLASVVKDEPDWSKLPKGSPEGLLRRCLHKDRKLRLQAIGEARIILANPESGAESPAQATSLPHMAWAAVAIALAAVALWGWLRPRPAEPKPVMRFGVALPQSTGQANPSPSLSRDGSMLAYRTDPAKARLHSPHRSVRRAAGPWHRRRPGSSVLFTRQPVDRVQRR
jgi:serine/threonine protein kinase